MQSKILKYILYFVIFLSCLLLPIYGTARLILPNYIKNEIIRSLPQGSTLTIGSISSKPNLGIIFEKISFKSEKNKVYLNSPRIEVSPQFEFSKPLKIISEELVFKNFHTNAKLKNLQAELFVKKYNKREVSVQGKVNEVENGDDLIFSQLVFLLDGLNSKSKSIKLKAKTFFLNYANNYGSFEISGNNLNSNSSLSDNASFNINIENLQLNLSELKPTNENRKIFSDYGVVEINLLKDENWTAPISIHLRNSKSLIDEIAENIKISTTGFWAKGSTECEYLQIINNDKSCGYLRDFLDISILVEGKDKGSLLVVGEGVCVTPNAGCPQRITAEIKSKNTIEIFSKFLLSGVVNPILGGVLMSSLLTSPNNSSGDHDHEVKFDMIGSKILLNDKPVL